MWLIVNIFCHTIKFMAKFRYVSHKINFVTIHKFKLPHYYFCNIIIAKSLIRKKLLWQKENVVTNIPFSWLITSHNIYF